MLKNFATLDMLMVASRIRPYKGRKKATVHRRAAVVAASASPVGYDNDVIELGIPGEIIDDAY